MNLYVQSNGVALNSSATYGSATIYGQVLWNGEPVIDDDDGGTAGVREPRRPSPSPLAPAAAALELASCA